MTADSAETIADRYTVLEKIGEGGMGAVYLARDTQLDRTVAIKILRAQMTNDAAVRFHREAKAIARLKHGAISTALDFGVSADGQPYLILDYLEGDTLDNVLEKNGGPLEPNTAVDVADRICEGLAYAHASGVIHRDIKPSNIFLLYGEAHGYAVRILDFGVARFKEDQHLTTTGSIIGSPVYMSPEQARGQECDERSDLYSLGCVLFEMLTGGPPLLGATAAETMAMKSAEDAPLLSQKAPHIKFPGRLEEIVSKCLQRIPSQRYSSITDLEADLKEFAEAGQEGADELQADESLLTQLIAVMRSVTLGGVISAVRNFFVSRAGKLIAIGGLVSLVVTGIITFVTFGDPPKPADMNYHSFDKRMLGIIVDETGTHHIQGKDCCFKSMPTLEAVKLAASEMRRKRVTAMTFDAVAGAMPAQFIRELKPVNLRSLFISHAILDSACLEAIGELDTIESLKLSSCRLEGDLFKQPEKLTNLHTLAISRARLTRKDLDAILRLPGLVYLDVARNEGVTADFIRSLGKIEKLRSLCYGAGDTKRDQVEAVSQVKRLVHFEVTTLNDALLTDAIASMTRLPLLRSVTITDCKSNHELFKQLAKVTALAALKFDRVEGVTRGDLLELKDLKHLEHMEFELTKPTQPEEILAILNIKALKDVRISGFDDFPPEVAEQLKSHVKVINTF